METYMKKKYVAPQCDVAVVMTEAIFCASESIEEISQINQNQIEGLTEDNSFSDSFSTSFE